MAKLPGPKGTKRKIPSADVGAAAEKTPSNGAAGPEPQEETKKAAQEVVPQEIRKRRRHGDPQVVDWKADPANAALAQEAIGEILALVTSSTAPAAGTVGVPQKWSTRFKPSLGFYRDFVESVPDKLAVHRFLPGDFVVTPAGAKAPAPREMKEKGQLDWKQTLHQAWDLYVQAVPDASARSVKDFAAPLPKTAWVTAGRGGQEGPAAEGGPPQRAKKRADGGPVQRDPSPS